MYEQKLLKIVEPIKLTTIDRLNRSKSWKYGYNKEHDVIVISRTGQIGEIYEIQNLKIALPKAGKVNKENDRWVAKDYPNELKNIKTIFDWENYPEEFKNKWFEYIDTEFTRREKGFWFNNKNVPTYITGSHYMYLQWTKIDVGKPDFREANRLFFIFGKHAKRTNVVMECVILKTVDPDLVSCLRAKPSIRLQLLQTHASVYCPNLELMLRRCLPIKSFRYHSIYRSSLNQYRMEWIGRNQNSRTGYPRQSLPKNPLPRPMKKKFLKGSIQQ